MSTFLSTSFSTVIKNVIEKKTGKFETERHQLIFNPNIINDIKFISSFLQANQLEFDKQFSKEQKATFFSGVPQGVFNLSENFAELISHYLLVIQLCYKNNNYELSLSFYLFMVKSNINCLEYLFQKIRKNLPFTTSQNNIRKFYPSIILNFLKVLSCLIKTANQFKKQKDEFTFITYYLLVIYYLKNTIQSKSDISTKEKEQTRKIYKFISYFLFQVAMYCIHNYISIKIPLQILTKIKDIYCNENNCYVDFSQQVNYILLKTFYNLGLLQYISGNIEESITNVENARKRCATLKPKSMSFCLTIDPNSTSKYKNNTETQNENELINGRSKKRHKSISLSRGSNPILEMNLCNLCKHFEYNCTVKKIEMTLGEMYLEKGNYIKAFTHFKNTIDVLNSNIMNNYYNEQSAMERKIIENFLIKIETLVNKEIRIHNAHNACNYTRTTRLRSFHRRLRTTIVRTSFGLEENTKRESLNENSNVHTNIINDNNNTSLNNIKPKTKSKNNNIISTIAAAQKFFLFLTTLNAYQIAMLNNFQPKDIPNFVELPIFFPNKFRECLTFSQRNTLDTIHTISLCRYIILKDPRKEISLRNLDYNLFLLNNKILIDDDSSQTVQLNEHDKTKNVFNYFKQNDTVNKVMKALFQREKLKENERKSIFKHKSFIMDTVKCLSEKESQDLIDNPNIIRDVILNYENDKKRKEIVDEDSKEKEEIYSNSNYSYFENEEEEDKIENKSLLYESE